MKMEKCLNCGKPLIGKSQKKFCGHKCSALFNNRNRTEMSDETKRLISETLKEKCKNRKTKRVCVVCGNEFLYTRGINTKKICSKKCQDEYKSNRIRYMTLEGREKISINARNVIKKLGDEKRSKNEKLFYDMCNERFINVEHNKTIFNGWDADIIIHDYKIAVLWQGAWHYKQISKKTKLSQIQNRDTLKIKEIERFGYTPYIIKDMGKFDENKVKDEFKRLQDYIKINWDVD